ncbi:MAG: bifunctional hydroxymethylpyrimidine kinase/phosphomethylpyrimidine kinase [Acidimicrobiales bacterium]
MGALEVSSPPVALTIAGSDSGGGAGIVADVKTFAAHGVWATAAITAVTAQNTVGVQRVALLEPEMVAAQIDSVCADMAVSALKTGALGSGPIVAAVADAVRRHRLMPLVIDPVAVSTSGVALLDPDGLRRLVTDLVPLAAVVTPNLAEAVALTGFAVGTRTEMEHAGRELVARGCGAALVTGGHLRDERAVDCLVRRQQPTVWLEGPWVPGPGSHGSGCGLSAAICAGLASGLDIEAACRQAKSVVTASLRMAVAPGAGPAAANPGPSWRA